MTDDQRPYPDAEKVQGWWESLDEQDQQRVRELIETGGELPADITDGLRSPAEQQAPNTVRVVMQKWD